MGDSITECVSASCPPCNTSRHGLQPCGAAGCQHAWPGQLQLLPQHMNWGHVAATMQRTTNCDKTTACDGRLCPTKGRTGAPTTPCRSNGPPYWVTNEFARATNRMAPVDGVIIMLGTNDAKYWHWLGNETQYTTDAAAMVRTFQALPQKPKVFLSTPPPLYHATYTMNQTVVGTIMPRILRAIAEETGCEFLDMITPVSGWLALSEPELFLPNTTHGRCDALKYVNIVKFVFKTKNFVSKTRNFVFQMMNTE